MRFLLRSFGLCLFAITSVLILTRQQTPQQWYLFEVFPDGGGVHLYRARADGSEIQRVTDAPTIDIQLIWSPNRAWLLLQYFQSASVEFVRMRPQGIDPIIFPTRISNNFQVEVWQPDERRLVLSENPIIGKLSGLYSIANNGRDLQALSDALNMDSLVVGDDSRVFYSPDQQWLLYFSDSSLYRMRGDEVQQIFSKEGLVSRLQWSPDGQWLFFSFTDNTNRTAIYRIRLDGRDMQELTPDFKESFLETLSPDGQWLIFNRDQRDLYRMRLDGSQLENMTLVGNGAVFQSWSPDRTWMLFAAAENGKSQLYRMNADGSHQTRLTNNIYWNTFEDWSPDGQWIFFRYLSEEDKSYEVAKMRLDGTDVQNLSNTPQLGDAYAATSADGRWLFLLSERDGKTKLFKMRPDGSHAQQVVQTSGSSYFVDWIPIVDLPWRAWLMLAISGVSLALSYLLAKIRL